MILSRNSRRSINRRTGSLGESMICVAPASGAVIQAGTNQVAAIELAYENMWCAVVLILPDHHKGPTLERVKGIMHRNFDGQNPSIMSPLRMPARRRSLHAHRNRQAQRSRSRSLSARGDRSHRRPSTALLPWNIGLAAPIRVAA
jgi:hypothetical protein